MLVSATALLEHTAQPTEAEVKDALGGVLCRCTGYRKIINAVLDVHPTIENETPPASGTAVGQRLIRLDGLRKINGTEIFGADEIPANCLTVRAIRSPYHRAKFQFGDLKTFAATHPGIEAIFTAKDVPGEDCYGVIPPFADQPIFAREDSEARYRGEAITAVVGDTEAIEALDPKTFPVTWEELPPLKTIEEALAPDARLIHAHRPNNILTGGRVARGDVDAALASAYAVVEAEFETTFVEHAAIEPEAGFARWVEGQNVEGRDGDTIEIQACTQSPYMDRADIAKLLGKRAGKK